MEDNTFVNKSGWESVKEILIPNKNHKKLGGEIYQQKQKTEKVVWTVLGIITFIVFNVVLSILTHV